MNNVLERIAQASKAFEIHVMRDESDTLDLRYGILPAKNAGASGTKRWLVFANGRTEWIEKYAYLPADLNLPDDCGFLTWDHRGQGASGGARAYVDSYESFAQDAAQIIHKVVGKAPFVTLSHSMGGLILLYATLTGKIAPQAMMMSSPLLGLPDHPLPRSISRPVARAMTALKLGLVSTGVGNFTKAKFVGNRLTHHAELFERMHASPYPVPAATCGWVAASFAAIDSCFSPEALAKLHCPVLVMGGTDERVVDPEGFRAFTKVAAEHAKLAPTLRLIHGGRHELFSESPEFYDQAIAEVRAALAQVWAQKAASGAR